MTQDSEVEFSEEEGKTPSASVAPEVRTLHWFDRERLAKLPLASLLYYVLVGNGGALKSEAQEG
jgi:hypothetical protein